MRDLKRTKVKRMASVMISLIVVFFLVCIILMLVSLRVQLIRIGYELEGIRRQRTQLIKQQKLLLSELACADSSSFRMPDKKRQIKFVVPDERCNLITMLSDKR